MSEILLQEQQDGVLTLTLNRPKANAFNLALTQELRRAILAAGRDATVRVIVLTGQGRIFSAGQDLREILAAEEMEGDDISFRRHLEESYNPLIRAIRGVEKPVIAAINGPVAGAGLGVALACDLRIAADTATFVVGFLGIGLVPDSGTALTLPLLLGLARATEYAFTNRPISAEQALAWGLVNRLAPADRLSQEAFAWAQELARGPVHTMGLTKRAFNRLVMPHLEEALAYEAQLQEIAGRSPEHHEGLRAFLEKRPPQFH